MLAGDAGESAVAVVAAESSHSDGATSPIVFFDSHAEDLSELAVGIPDGCEIVMIDSGSDALQQITATLSGRRDVRSIHFLTHGREGEVRFGGQTIDGETLRQQEAMVAGWRNALSPDADIVIYGCDVGAGRAGEAFVHRLAELTGADVAASSDRTGHVERGGDWEMEVRVGRIETGLVVTPTNRERFRGVMAITIEAAGQTGEENMELRVDGQSVASWSGIGGDAQNREFESFTYDGAIDPEASNIEVVFTNDFYIEGVIDRNLFVNRILVDDEVIEAEDPTVLSTGTWREGIGFAPGLLETESLHGNGYLSFTLDEIEAHAIEIFAAGETGDETMALEIDGEVVRTWESIDGDATSRDFTRLTYQSEERVAPEHIRILFLNDVYEPGVYDRNLVVDRIVIDGQTIQTESVGTFSTGTWKAEDGIAPGYRTNEVLHTDGYFRYSSVELGGQYRNYDGFGNNLQNPEFGAVESTLVRDAPADYADGVSELAGADRPGPREISNEIVAADPDAFGNDRGLSVALHVWGQFIDHDLDLTEPPASGGEPLSIPVPLGDPFFDPFGTGTATIDTSRSESVEGTGTDPENPRQHANGITAYLDGSMIYGSSPEVAQSLRSGVGGRLLESEGGLLPLVNGQFVAGDIRAEENVNLTAMHILFLREHNFWADQLALENPSWSDEQIFQEARRVVVAEVQAITFNEFLPTLLGANAVTSYTGYDSNVNAGIATEFSTAAFRVGHTMINDEVRFLDNDGNEISPSISLAEAFFNPDVLLEQGIDSSLKFIASVQTQEIDNQIVDSLRNFLFGPPGGWRIGLGIVEHRPWPRSWFIGLQHVARSVRFGACHRFF